MRQSAVSREYWFSKKIAHRTGSNRDWVYLNPGNAVRVSTRLSQFGKRFSVGVIPCCLSYLWSCRSAQNLLTQTQENTSRVLSWQNSPRRWGREGLPTLLWTGSPQPGPGYQRTRFSPFRETQLKAKGHFLPLKTNFEQKANIYINNWIKSQ